MHLEHWIGDNLDTFRSLRLDELVLPGTHNSGAFELAPQGVELEGPWWKKGLIYRMLSSLARPLAAPWTLTQDADLTSQLLMGYRFFDLRVSTARLSESSSRVRACRTNPGGEARGSWPRRLARFLSNPCLWNACSERGGVCHLQADPSESTETSPPIEHRMETSGVSRPDDKTTSRLELDSTFYVTHTLPCVALEDVLLQLRNFMEQHEREVVAVRICPDWSNRDYLGHHEGEKVLKLVRVVNSDPSS